jgi:lambda repressor-like predicted transcriptional regulator
MSLDAVVRQAIRRAPCSIRALARDAGVSHVLLAEIVAGRRRATPRVAMMLARALEQWGDRCHKSAAQVRTTATRISKESSL